MGYGDTDPSNVYSLLRGAAMPVAAARAVNCGLRKTYVIGRGSVEELRWGSGGTPDGENEKNCPRSGQINSAFP